MTSSDKVFESVVFGCFRRYASRICKRDTRNAAFIDKAVEMFGYVKNLSLKC